MAKAKAAAKPAPKSAAKPAKAAKAAAPAAALGKPKKDAKTYTKNQLFAHLAGAVEGVSKKQAAALVTELVGTMVRYAELGAPLPGLGKLVLRKTPARPAREGINPRTGEKITIAKKPAGKKLVFRFNKIGKAAAGI